MSTRGRGRGTPAGAAATRGAPRGRGRGRGSGSVSSGPDKITKDISQEKLDGLFDQIRSDGVQAGDESSSPNIQPEGVTKLCTDLGIDPDGVDYLLLASLLKTATPFEISRSEFTDGMKQLGCQDIAGLKKVLQQRKAALKHEDEFKKLYMFCFEYMKQTPTAKNIPIENAVATWSVLLEGRFPLLEQWQAFVQENAKAISLDNWRMLLKFATTIGKDLDKYSDEDGWPVLIDDFVEDMKSR